MSEITKQIVHVVNLLPSFFPNKIHEKAKLEAQLANVEEENICTHNSTVVIRACFSFFHRKAHKIIIFSCFHDVFMIFYFIIFYHTFLISVMVHSFFFNNVKDHAIFVENEFNSIIHAIIRFFPSRYILMAIL